MDNEQHRRAGAPSKKRAGAVLVIEDDDSVRRAIAGMLRSSGFAAVEAASGAEGFEKLRGGPVVAMVLLDLNMAAMDGRAFRRLQLADPNLATIPTVILTGAPLVEVDDATLRADDYLLKPVGREHLVSVVSAYCAAAS